MSRMHTLTLLLDTTTYDDFILNKRFHALSHLHNTMVRRAKGLLKYLNQNPVYKNLLKQRKVVKEKQKELNKQIKASDNPNAFEKEKQKLLSELKELTDKLNAIRNDIGFSEYGFQKYLKRAAKRYTRLLSSMQVQKEATRVWQGAKAVHFGKGKFIHFKKFMDFDTIEGKDAKNGIYFDKDALMIYSLGLEIKCKIPKQKSKNYRKTHPDTITSYDYIMESFKSKVKYCSLKRQMFNSGWRYYVILCLDGDAPMRYRVGKDTMGIDPGVSTVAGVGDHMVVLKELAPRTKEYNKAIAKVQQKMDVSKRLSNPDNFKEDGTCKKGKKTWVFSKNYKRNQRKCKTLYRKKSAYIKTSHGKDTNELLKEHQMFIAEKMDFKALAKKAKETKRQAKESVVKNKQQVEKIVHKYKKKKRFGKSICDRSPGLFLSMLQKKCQLGGGTFVYVNTKTFKASQYNHDTDKYEKVPLSQREKEINGVLVQRDLYSAFLLRNADSTLKKADKEQCEATFHQFVTMQNQLLKDMQAKGISMKACFGF